MSWEAWGSPPDPEPGPECELCCNELGSSEDCTLCKLDQRACELEAQLLGLKFSIAHRLRVLRSRSVYEGGKKENGVSVELLQAISLLCGTPGLDFNECPAEAVLEAETALLTFENAQYIYPPRKPLK